ncbi:MAG: response regulator [Candidatus Colwellbacteria bacterium]|nr:response regulator [Candidatus Colwellbacteria bacterium]
MKKIKITFVEDEALLRTLFEDSIEAFKDERTDTEFSMNTVPDFSSAMKLLEEGQVPDIVILDLRLPSGKGEPNETPEKEYGFEILKKIKADPRFDKMPVIVFTNLADHETEHKAYALGADAFMVKSKVVPNELFDAVLKTIKEVTEKTIC